MEKRGNTGVIIACAAGAALIAGALYYYFFVVNKFNHYYGLPEANEWVTNYESQQGPQPWGFLASADNIRTYLNSSPAPAYIHISLGLDSLNNQVLVLSGVQKDYSHVFVNNQVLQGGYSCPGGYDPNSETSVDLAVNNRFDPGTPNSIPRPGVPVTGGYDFIPVAEGQEQINRYLSANPTNDSLNPVGWLISCQLMNEILNQEGCRYLHIARGTAVHGTENARIVILAGVDQNYNHLYRMSSGGPQIVESLYPCPICIDITESNRPETPVQNDLTP